MQCRLCGSGNLTLYYVQGNKNQYKYYKCPVCKLVNYDLAGRQDQNKYASEKYIDPYNKSKKMNIDQKNAYNFIKHKVKTRGKLLDIGCGNGKLLLEAKSDGWNVRGLELSKFLAKSINQKYGIEVDVVNFLEYKPRKDETYDLVVLRHVLEHLRDSILAMNKINSLLRSGGVAVLEFPDIEGMELRIKRLLNKIGLHRKKYKPSYKPGHCNEFCWDSFNYLVEKTGFQIVEWNYYSSKPVLDIFYNKLNFGTKVRTMIIKK